MYIEQAYKGLSDAWRYIIGVFVVFMAWQFFGAIPLIAALLLKTESLAVMASGEIGEMSKALGSNTFLFYMLLTFAIGLVCLFGYVKFMHKQTITQLTTSRRKIDWKRVFFAFLLWGTLSAVFVGVDVYFFPENYELNFQFKPFLILAVIAIVLIPIQTSMEEYFMRGYMMQGLGIIAGNRLFPLLFTSILFGLMHIFNPEVAKLGYGIMVYYIGTGLFLGILTLMDEGLELPIGFHAANNLVTALLVTADWTAFQTHSIFRDTSEPELGWDVFIPVLIVYPILLFIFSKKYGWSNWKEKLTGKVLSKDEFLSDGKLNNDDNNLLEL